MNSKNYATIFNLTIKKLNKDKWYDHCDRYGYIKEECYSLISYLKGQKLATSDKEGKGNAATTVNVCDNAGGQIFILEQIKVLQEMTSKSSLGMKASNPFNIKRNHDA